ncbi:hypothetical protein ACH42_03065 [Endozoicomonas sp. (ex Bugula neritina AB1)]|nr:hypothetical protein ACH42_03065 [Endozoicomonas sp. (ex Bugula neritina AB1)]
MKQPWIAMDNLEVIRDKSKLEASCFIELLPGHYNGKHWGDKSIFILEDSFQQYLSAPIQLIVSRYDMYECTVVKKAQWIEIIEQYKKLLLKLETAKQLEELKPLLDIYGDHLNILIQQCFDQNIAILKKVISELIEWLQEQLKTKKCISIIGV